MTEQGSHKERVIVSSSLLSWNPSDFVYHPEFDLGIGDEWLPKHPVARVSTSIGVLNQDDSSKDDDAQFWQSIGAIENSKLIEVTAVKQSVPNSTLEEVPSAPEPKLACFHSPKFVGWMQNLQNYRCHSRSLIDIVTSSLTHH